VPIIILIILSLTNLPSSPFPGDSFILPSSPQHDFTGPFQHLTIPAILPQSVPVNQLQSTLSLHIQHPLTPNSLSVLLDHEDKTDMKVLKCVEHHQPIMQHPRRATISTTTSWKPKILQTFLLSFTWDVAKKTCGFLCKKCPDIFLCINQIWKGSTIFHIILQHSTS
jgi:hypothetical protein